MSTKPEPSDGGGEPHEKSLVELALDAVQADFDREKRARERLEKENALFIQTFNDFERQLSTLQQSNHVMREALEMLHRHGDVSIRVLTTDEREKIEYSLSSTPPSDLIAKSDVMPIVEKLQRLSHICSCGAGSSKPTTKHAGHCACCLALDALALATHLGLVKEGE